MSAAESFEPTSLSLINRVRLMDADAWQRLADLYGPLVYKWVRQAGVQACDASDVSQEVFRVVLARVSDFRRDRSGDSFRGWLWGITRNKLREHFRRNSKFPVARGGSELIADAVTEETMLPVEVEPDSDTEATIAQATARMLQNEFEPTTWQCFERMVLQDQAAVEIAKDLGMTSKAVRQAKYRVLQRLRRELDDLL